MRLRKPHHREFKVTCPRSWNKWDGRYSNTGVLAPEFVRLTSHAMLLLLISNNTQKPQRRGDSRGPAWGSLGDSLGKNEKENRRLREMGKIFPSSLKFLSWKISNIQKTWNNAMNIHMLHILTFYHICFIFLTIYFQCIFFVIAFESKLYTSWNFISIF